jgi:hypothetical protein
LVVTELSQHEFESKWKDEVFNKNMTIKGHGRVTTWLKPVKGTKEKEPGWYQYINGKTE